MENPDDYYPYHFVTSVDRLDFGRFAYHVAFLPPDLEPTLPFGPGGRLRVEAEIGEFGWKGAFVPSGEGRHYLLLNRTSRSPAAGRG